MKSRCGSGLLAMGLTLFMIIGCAETPKQATPPPAPRTTAVQEKPADDMEIVREKVRADKKLLVSMNMGLTESEAKKFWPIYDRYQLGLDRLVDRQLEIIETFAKNYDTMSDAIARQLLEDYLLLEDDRLALRQAYLPKFRGAIPEIKVARYYQIENKIQAIVDVDLAANVPLVK